MVSRAALMWVLALQACAALAPPAPHKALPNQRVIGPQLVTAGQPSRAQLMALKAQGFEAVIHIDAGSTPDSVSDEAQLVAAQAIVYVHVAVDPQALTATNARAISRAIDGFGARRVLVHCEQNMLSSSFVFLNAFSTATKNLGALWPTSSNCGCLAARFAIFSSANCAPRASNSMPFRLRLNAPVR